MKRIYAFLAILAFAALAAQGHAQTNLQVLPAPTQHAANLSWTNSCPSQVSCTFDAYACAGAIAACPATTTPGSNPLWLKLNSAPITTTTYQDARAAVVSGATFSYVVYADANVVNNGVTVPETAGPSNEVAVTILWGR